MASANHSTLAGSLVVGFQGWFMCPGDGRPNGGWWHWFFENKPDPSHLHFDLMPDTREFADDLTCPTSMTSNAGSPVRLFSDQNPKVVERQFGWMRDYGIDAAALQRFVVDIDPDHPVAGRPAVDRVLANVRGAAAATGVGFYVMYDIVGADPQRWADVLLDDWTRLLASGLTGAPEYQHHKGRPVLAIAGVGSDDRPGTAQQVIDLVSRLRAASQSAGGVTVVASTATGWRTRDGDAKHEPEWDAAYGSFDVLSPWTVGRYKDPASFEHFVETRLRPDMAEAKRRGIEYMPVIFPGFSWHNLMGAEHRPADLNGIPREGGRFLWMQAATAREEGATMLYAAMFDEVDEGTALFKLAPDHSTAPRNAETVTLDQDGTRLSSDWYLKLSGAISALLKGKIKPAPELPIH